MAGDDRQVVDVDAEQLGDDLRIVIAAATSKVKPAPHRVRQPSWPRSRDHGPRERIGALIMDPRRARPRIFRPSPTVVGSRWSLVQASFLAAEACRPIGDLGVLDPAEQQW